MKTIHPPPNQHRVPKKQWSKWSFGSQCLFNQVFHALLNNQDAITGPDAILYPKKVWRVTAWNAAFIAADELRWLEENRPRSIVGHA